MQYESDCGSGGQALCRYDTIARMRANTGLTAAVFCVFATLSAQTTDDPVAVFTEHPRLFLRPQRIRLLKRERERASPRWQQFETLVAGNAPMPQPGFAWALYYQVSGDADFGKKAVAWSRLLPAADLRQRRRSSSTGARTSSPMSSAAIFPPAWPKPSPRPPIPRSPPFARGPSPPSPSTITFLRPRRPRSRRSCTSGGTARWLPALRAGKSVVPRDEAYPLWELLHAIRDNTNLDLRENIPRFFKDFPIEHLLSHYPATYDAPENQYRIGLTKKSGEPNLQAAALSRAAELEMVALDVNAPESQVLQGWLMHDHFMLRGVFGAPYEYLWANPYQPGLSYYHVPLIYHNADFGKLFVRSSWDEDAEWFGYFDGTMQMFSQGHLTPLSAQLNAPPISPEEALICFAQRTRKFRVTLDEEEAVFLLGLQPRHTYQVEIDDEEVFETDADAGGILELDVPRGKSTGVRIKEVTP